MMRPFYKSMTLWLGLPGFLFLVWAWWDGRAVLSMMADHFKGGTQLYLGNDRYGATVLLQTTHKNADLFQMMGILRGEVHFNRIAGHYSCLYVADFDETEPGSYYYDVVFLNFGAASAEPMSEPVRLPHPVLLAIYSAAWAGAFAWRVRRMRTAMLPE